MKYYIYLHFISWFKDMKLIDQNENSRNMNTNHCCVFKGKLSDFRNIFKLIITYVCRYISIIFQGDRDPNPWPLLFHQFVISIIHPYCLTMSEGRISPPRIELYDYFLGLLQRKTSMRFFNDIFTMSDLRNTFTLTIIYVCKYSWSSKSSVLQIHRIHYPSIFCLAMSEGRFKLWVFSCLLQRKT